MATYDRTKKNLEGMSDDQIKQYAESLKRAGEEGQTIENTKYEDEGGEALRAFQDVYNERFNQNQSNDTNIKDRQQDSQTETTQTTTQQTNQAEQQRETEQQARNQQIQESQQQQAQDRRDMQQQAQQQAQARQDRQQQTQQQDQTQTYRGQELETEQEPSLERKKQIVENLKSFEQTNPEAFENKEAYDEFFGTVSGEQRSEAEQKLVDRYWDYRQKQKTTASRQNELYSKPSQEIANGIISGNYTIDDINDLKQQDPNKYQQVMEMKNKAQEYAQANKNINDEAEGDGTVEVAETGTFMDGISQVAQQMGVDMKEFFGGGDDFSPREKYNEIVNTEENQELQKQVTKSKAKLTELQNQKADLMDTLRDKYPNLSKEALNAAYNDEVEDINKQIRTQTGLVNTNIEMYNSSMNMAQNEYSALLEQQNLERQERMDNMQKMQFAYGIYKDYQDRQATMQMNAEKAAQEWELFKRKKKWEEGDIYSDDPELQERAIDSAVQDTLDYYEGLPIQRSKQKIVQDIKGVMAQGKSLGQAIDENLRQPIQQKDVYDTWVADKLGVEAPEEERVKIGDKYYNYNQEKDQFEPIKIVEEARVIGKGQDNPYLGKSGGSLTWRTNNPGALTASSKEHADKLAERYGAIKGQYSLDANGGYVLNFENMDQGYNAMQSLLDSNYRNLTLKDMAKKWTGGGGTGTVRLMRNSGLDVNKKYGELDVEDRNTVMKAIKNNEYMEEGTEIDKIDGTDGYNPSLMPTYTKYMESGVTPTESQLKKLGGLETFVDQARTAYVENQNRIYEDLGFKLEDPDVLLSLSPKERSEFRQGLEEHNKMIAKLDDVISTIEEIGIDRNPVGTERDRVKQKIQDILIVAKGPSFMNLGVLNGPDLQILQEAIAGVTREERLPGGEKRVYEDLKGFRDITMKQTAISLKGKGVKMKDSYTGDVGNTDEFFNISDYNDYADEGSSSSGTNNSGTITEDWDNLTDWTRFLDSEQ